MQNQHLTVLILARADLKALSPRHGTDLWHQALQVNRPCCSCCSTGRPWTPRRMLATSVCTLLSQALDPICAVPEQVQLQLLQHGVALNTPRPILATSGCTFNNLA